MGIRFPGEIVDSQVGFTNSGGTCISTAGQFINVATINVTVPPNGRVFLTSHLSWESQDTSQITRIRVEIIRDNTLVLARTVDGVEAVQVFGESEDNAALTALDTSASPGPHLYQLRMTLIQGTACVQNQGLVGSQLVGLVFTTSP
jgi:hypothetical protein